MVMSEYVNGEMNGVVKGYYENGQVMMITDKYSTTIFYENGQEEFIENSYEGIPHGLTKTWFENGNKRGQTNYRNGIRDGRTLEWYENGQLRSDILYEDGYVMYEQYYDELGLKIDLVDKE